MSFGIWTEILALKPTSCVKLGKLLLNNLPNVVHLQTFTMCQPLFPKLSSFIIVPYFIWETKTERLNYLLKVLQLISGIDRIL